MKPDFPLHSFPPESDMASIAASALLTRQRLPHPFASDAVRPSYDGLGLANAAALTLEWLSPDALHLSEQPSLPPFDPTLLGMSSITQAWEQWHAQAPINHVVFMLFDALGYDQLQTAMANGDAPHLAAACKQPQTFFMPATSVFPSTTVAALTSAATAYAPAQHGVVCTHMYLPAIGSLVNFIGWRPSLSPSRTPYADEQLNPDTFIPVPNLYLRLEKAGVDVEIINFHQFRNTSISRFTTAHSQAGQEKFKGYLTPMDGFAQLRDRLQSVRQSDKSFTYFYVPNLDTAAHRYGPLTSSYQAELAALDFALHRELLEPLQGQRDTVLLIMADHGQCATHPDRVLWLHQHPDLLRLMFAPATGEPRARFLHLKHGAEAAAIDYIQQHLGEHFFVLPIAEALELGLLGLPSQSPTLEACERSGDLILFPRQDWSCYRKLGQVTEDSLTHPIGVHGGLSRAEMLIPFLAYRF